MNIKNYIILPGLFLVLILLLQYCTGNTASSSDTQNDELNNQFYYSQGQFHYDNNEYEQAAKNFLLGLEQARERKNAGDMREYTYSLGLCYERLGNNNLAKDYFFRFLEFPTTTTSSTKRAMANSLVSNIYQEQSDFSKAYEYQLESLKISEALKNINGISRSNYSLGTINYYQENYEKALEFYLKGAEVSKNLDNTRVEFSYLGGIGSVYEKLGDLEKSLEYNLKSLELAKTFSNKTSLGYALQNTGANYIELKQFDKAETALLEALAIQNTKKRQYARVGVLRDLGKLYTNTKEYDKAIDYLNQGIIISREIDSKSRVAEIFKALSHTYEQSNRPKEAIQYLKEHTNVKDSILNEKSSGMIAQALKDYEVAQKEREIVILEKDQQLSKKNVYMLVGFLVFVSMFLLIVFYYYRSQKRLNSELEIKNVKIQDQNAKLEEKNNQIQLQNEELAKINNELQQFTSVASHDLRSPLRTISSFSNLLARRYKDILDEQAQEYLGFIQTGTNRMMNMINDLLEYARMGKDEIPNEWLESRELVEEALFNLQENIKDEDALIRVDKTRLPKIQANRTQMVQLFQNLIGNAIKFRSSKRPEVEVFSYEENGTNVFYIKDNGIGIDPEYQEKAFKMFGRINGRTEYEGTGIGLATCKKIVQSHGGDIWLESEEGKGSTFYFSIPLQQEVLQD